MTAHQRTALEVRDRHCVVPGCHQTGHLEIDHVDGWAQTGITKLDRLARLCHFHHAQKTYDGYRLEGTPGHWTWTPPDDTQVEPQARPPGQPPDNQHLGIPSPGADQAPVQPPASDDRTAHVGRSGARATDTTEAEVAPAQLPILELPPKPP